MERGTAHDWFTCLRCGTHAEQIWLSARTADALPVRWSTCSACHQITIWGSGAVVPGPRPPAGDAAGDAERDAARDDPPAGAALDALWDAITGHLVEPEDTPPRGRPSTGT